jgi:hypothetical protein
MNDKFIEMLANYLFQQKEHLEKMQLSEAPEGFVGTFEDGRILGQLLVIDQMIKLLSLKPKNEDDGESKNNQE